MKYLTRNSARRLVSMGPGHGDPKVALVAQWIVGSYKPLMLLVRLIPFAVEIRSYCV